MKLFDRIIRAAAPTLLIAMLLGAFAFAQTTTLDQTPAPSGTTPSSQLLTQSIAVSGGTLYVTILKQGGAQGQPIAIAQNFVSTSANSYTFGVVGTGWSYTFQNLQDEMLFDPAGTVTAGTVVMAPAPVDGKRACVFSTAAITTLTVSANSGQTINDAVTTLAANGRVCYTYALATTVWNRSQ